MPLLEGKGPGAPRKCLTTSEALPDLGLLLCPELRTKFSIEMRTAALRSSVVAEYRSLWGRPRVGSEVMGDGGPSLTFQRTFPALSIHMCAS